MNLDLLMMKVYSEQIEYIKVCQNQYSNLVLIYSRNLPRLQENKDLIDMSNKRQNRLNYCLVYHLNNRLKIWV